jgi:hypothetical protein
MLRRGRVVSIEGGADARVIRAQVELDDAGELRAALAYPDLTGPIEPGDDVLVNVEAQELGLGSGGFDVLYANLTRGIAGEGRPGAHVMKLNYSPLQHAVEPVEEGAEQMPEAVDTAVAVIPLHGQLPCAVFALARRAPDARVGYVQTQGGALPGSLSRTVADLIDRGMLAGHITVAPCFGALEAITLEGALAAAATRLGWDAAVIGPGPGILGSASALGHGGIAALHSAHSALAVGARVTLAPRLSSGDARERHRGLSHHTRTVLALLLRPVTVAVPDGIPATLRADLADAAATGGHALEEAPVGDLIEPYRESGLPVTTMGRSLDEDEDFFRAGLAAGAVLAQRIGGDV